MKKTLSKHISYIMGLCFIAVTFTMCTNTKKDTKEDLGNLETKTKEEVSTEKLNFDYKIAHAQALLSIEEAKVHFIVETNKFKAQADLDKTAADLSKIKNTGDKDYDNFATKTILDIEAIKKAIDSDDANVKTGLETVGVNIANQMDRYADDTNNEMSNVEKEYERHYAELRAKQYLYRAKIESKNADTFSKAGDSLSKADQEYAKAQKYGNKEYSASLDNLRKNIQKAQTSLIEKEIDASGTIDVVIFNLDSISDHTKVDYPYILLL